MNGPLRFDGFRMRVRFDDAVVRDHRVHGVRILPGATYLDALLRAAAAAGHDPSELMVDDLLFHRPVALDVAGAERRLVFEPTPHGDALRFEIREEHAADARVGECVLRRTDGVKPASMPVAQLLHGAELHELDEIYDVTEQMGIRHRGFMRLVGQVARLGDDVLVRLELGEEGRAQSQGFLIHPAMLDTSTLLPFALSGATPGAAYIPLYVKRFRCWGPAGRVVYAWTRARGAAGTSDVERADLLLMDVQGRPVAQFEGLTIKRVRTQELIQRLVEEPAAVGEPEAMDLVGTLVAMVADRKGLQPAQIATDVGFYDLGLDSSDLLALVRGLEERSGQELFPTLLFEHQTIDALAAFLRAEVPALTAATPEGPQPKARAQGNRSATESRGIPTRAPAEAAVEPHDAVRMELRWTPVQATPSPAQTRWITGPDRLDDAAVDAFVARTLAESEQQLWALRPAQGATELLAVLAPFRALVRGLHRSPAARAAGVHLAAVVPDVGEGPLWAAALGGLARTAVLEVPHIAVGSVLAPADVPLATVAACRGHAEARLTSTGLEVRRLTEVAPGESEPALRRGAVILMSGGAGGIGRLLARRWAADRGARLVLVGRRPLDADVASLLAEIEALGGEAVYVPADVSSREGAQRAVAEARQHFGALHGVVHAAGVLADGVLGAPSDDRWREVVRVKAFGAVHLEAAAAGPDLEVVLLFSSLSAAVGNPGQADYAAANRFLDAFAESRHAAWRRSQIGHRVISVGWPLWATGGMGVPEEVAGPLRRQGLWPLPDDAGVALVEEALSQSRPHWAVAWGHVEQLRGRLAPPVAVADEGGLQVAVVGIAARYPDAPDLDALWRNLLDGHDAITEVPPERWDAAALGAGEQATCRHGGFLQGVDQFDPLFFRIPPAQAAQMDPQERLFLESAYRAVEHAGYRPAELAGPDNRVGVFVGVMWSDYRLLGVEHSREGARTSSASLLSSTANRVSHHFDFVGPSMAIDTACSSSLTAIHLACRSLASGECDAALAGGVNLVLHPDKYVFLRQLGMTSESGRCRSFGEGADGYVPGEGVGTLLLKPLQRALADGDTVYAVIRGSAINHGGRTAGYTVPHPASQADAIRRALDEAGLCEESLDYVEAHGTGTALGDPIEVQGLLGALQGRSRPCALGSVKSNLGHLEAAAGVAAVTRAVLQMHHGQLVPTLHSDRTNPRIDFAATPFYLPQQPAPWPTQAGAPRRAGVSGFGAGGANAHVVLEQPPPQPAVASTGAAEVVVLSAQTEAGLRRYAAEMAQALSDSVATLSEVARTLQVGRPALRVRLAFVARDRAEMVRRLTDFGEGGGEVHLGTEASGDSRGRVRPHAAGDLEGVAAQWAQGAEVDWRALFGPPPRRVGLPGPPLQRRRCWIDLGDASAEGLLDDALDRFEDDLGAPVPALEAHAEALARHAAECLATTLASMGWGVVDPPLSLAALQASLRIDGRFERLFAGCVQMLVRHGLARRAAGGVQLLEAPAQGELGSLSSDPEVAPYLALLDVALAAFPEVLRGQRPATEVLFPEGSFELTGAIYRGNRAYDFFSELAARFCGALAAAHRQRGGKVLRVLEVGAGTGGTTARLLEVLAAAELPVQYTFSDVGAGFLAHGRATFGERYPFVRFTRFDVGEDPVRQGLPPHGFDLVFAAHALHAAPDVDVALRNVRRLLAPGGVLLATESVVDPEVLALTFGLLDGWHHYTDPERRLAHSPLLSVQGWQQATARTGFTAFGAYGLGLSEDPHPSQRLILATVDPAVVDVAASAPVAAPVALQAQVQALVASAMGADPGELDPARSFADYGVDSLMAATIVKQVNEALGLQLKPMVLFDHPSVRALATHLEGATPEGPQPKARDQGRAPAVAATASPEVGGFDIAVIGMAGQFPGAADLDALWANLCAGHDAVTTVPASRWDVAAVYQPGPVVPGRTNSRYGAYLEDVASFDPLFFDMVPAEADFMDPQQRLFLQEAYKALLDAALDPTQLAGSRCGVFAGATGSDYATLVRERGLESHHAFTGNSPAVLPARIAYHLDLRGPCLSVDTACSSSLVAVHQACRSLRSGECEVALAGGVSVFVTPEYHLLASSLGMLSPGGRCRAFDESADGFVIGEGVGVVVLKPLQRALADGDPIRGVIKGIAVNQDGRTNGITAPSARSQAALEEEVYRTFDLDPGTVGYVEAHGTGTKLGDPIEMEALAQAFRSSATVPRRVAVGSVKSNIGHTSHAAGVAGLIKAMLVLEHGQIPPSLHLTQPNRLIDFDDGPFFVPTRLMPFEGPSPRRAAVSSFGFSGTNCHAVVQAAPGVAPTPPGRRPVLVPLSARTPAALQRQAQQLARVLKHRRPSLDDVAATLQRGRPELHPRLAVVAESLEDLVRGLEAPAGSLHVALGEVQPDDVPPPEATAADIAKARAWVRGAPGVLTGELLASGRRISLPADPFDPQRCWVVAQSEPRATSESRATSSRYDSLGPSPSAAGLRVQPPADPDEGLSVVVRLAAEVLGVPPAAVDPQVPVAELGLDEVGRAALVERIDEALGLQHPPWWLAAEVRLADLELGDAAPPSVERQPPPPTALPEAAVLAQRAEVYLKEVLAAECRLAPDQIRTRVPLADFGIDSVMIKNLNDKLEAAIGGLPKTLFFEVQTIAEVAEYLATRHAADLARVVGQASAASVPRSAPAPVPAPAAAAPHDAIAIIGMDGRYPMAADHQELWANLVAGKDCIRTVPPERWDHGAYVSDDPDALGRTYARWGGFIDDVDAFDPRFFGITPRDAESMDPQQRLFLQIAWHTLEDAGYTPERLRRSARARGLKDVGVYAGVTYAEYQAFVGVPIAGYWAVPNRVSYHLGFDGPSFAVDTACSASLTALHLAAEGLRTGACAYALAGGVNVSIHPGKYLLLGYGRWASTDGRCRAFGAGGDGYVPGEGVATLLLKPLSHALEDGDRIYGVIRGSGINHGGFTNGFTVPNPVAQQALVEEVLDTAGVDPCTIDYVEAHGTGTSLGDPIEIAALTHAFRRHTDERGFCAIGSLKSNVGHLEAAAGVAGVVKALLQLQHDTLVPSLHASPPNPAIELEDSPFEVVQTLRPFPRPVDPRTGETRPRRVSVSSFGAGGGNAYLVLEDPPDGPPVPAPTVSDHLLVVSARDAERLAELVQRLATFLEGEVGRTQELRDVAFTLQVGREPLEHRLALIASTPEQAVRALRSGPTWTGVAPTHRDMDQLPGEAQVDRQRLLQLAQAQDLSALAALWAQGWQMDWLVLTPLLVPEGRVVSLPGYPFARERYWIRPEEYVQARPSLAGPRERVEGDELGVESSVAVPEDAETLEQEVAQIFADLAKLRVDEIDPEVDFSVFGFDSVAAVRMLNRLQRRYDVKIPAATIQEHTTIRGFVEHVMASGYLRGESGMRDLDPVLREPAVEVEPLSLDAPLRADRIFVTGVTGVLGGRLLHDLLADSDAVVTCLVRGTDVEEARRRVAYFLHTYDPEHQLADALRQRVFVVLGDVTQDGLGLSPEVYDELVRTTDVTLHVAGKTTLVTFYDALAPINVEGTRRMIDFALQTPQKYLVYVSSFSALGDRLNFDNPPFRERDLELGQAYDHLPYQQTKYHAEKLIRAASAQGLLWNIFRPGNIMGCAETGRYPFAEVSVKGVYYDIFKTAVEAGVSGNMPVHWDISPVDYVSAGMLHLALQRPSYRETYHLTNPDVCRYTEVVALVRDHGYEVTLVDLHDFHRMISAGAVYLPGSRTPYTSQTLEMFKYGVEMFGMIHYEQSSYADCTYTRSLLEPVGIVCPPIRQLVPTYLAHCIEVGYLPPPDHDDAVEVAAR
ncbi:MAG: SDR family NAD(P)-dependent oxidoreductase [Myxococcales bacterium]|nr:SDR family NAD(P)-dependent oxidoreductase [Myxococcales bacterium]